MNRPQSRSRSRFLAAAVTIAAVLIMIAPLRHGSSHGEQARQAGWLPLVNLNGLADTNAFHRLGTSASRGHASAKPLFRPPTTVPAP